MIEFIGILIYILHITHSYMNYFTINVNVNVNNSIRECR